MVHYFSCSNDGNIKFKSIAIYPNYVFLMILATLMTHTALLTNLVLLVPCLS